MVARGVVMKKVASWIFCLVFLSVVVIGSASAVIPDTVNWDPYNVQWVIANGKDVATLKIFVTNTSGNSTAGLPIEFKIIDAGYGSLSSSSTTVQDGKASTVFNVGTKSGSVNISANVSYKVNESDPAEPYSFKEVLTQLNIDHDSPYIMSSYTVFPKITVGSYGDIQLAYKDQWGNPVDNRRYSEEIAFEISSPDGKAKIGSEGTFGTTFIKSVDADGNFKITMLASERPGTNILLANPVSTYMGDLPDKNFFIQAIADGMPVSIEQSFDPDGYLGQPPKQYADGKSLYQIVYTIKDQYGNGILNTPIKIRTSVSGEESTVSTNPWGQAMLTYGPKSSIGRITIYAESQINSSVKTSKEVMFISQYAVDIQFSANPETMPSRDVDGWTPAQLRAKVIDENGNPVEGETVTFTMGTPAYPDMALYNATLAPQLESSTDISDMYGYAEVLFDPGAFSTSWADPNFNPTSTGQVVVTAHWVNVSRGLSASPSLLLKWKNYPYLSLVTSVYPQTVNVSDTVDVEIQLRGDGWALKPNPIDVVLCTDRSGSMLKDIPDRMVAVKGASKVFNSQMSANRDRIGIVTFGTIGYAKIAPTPKVGGGWNWTNIYGAQTGSSPLKDSTGWWWASDDNSYECTPSSYSSSSVHQLYVNLNYPANPRIYADYAIVDLPLTFDRSTVDTNISLIVPSGGTPMRDAIYRSINLIISDTRSNTVKAIVVLSDGDYNSYGDPLARDSARGRTDWDPGDFGELSTYWHSYPALTSANQNLSAYAKNNGIKIYSIGFATSISTNGKKALRLLAEGTGGTYYDATGTNIADVYTAIAGELRTEAGVNTQADLDFGRIEVNTHPITVNDTYQVLEYVPDSTSSTWIHSVSGTGTDIIPAYVRNDTDYWNQHQRSIYFDAGTIKLGQVWTAKYKLRVLADGNINIFGPDSTIIFDNGVSTLLFPKTFITGVPGVVTTGVNSSELNVTSGESSSGSDASGVPYIEWPIHRHYTGAMNVTERYYI